MTLVRQGILWSEIIAIFRRGSGMGIILYTRHKKKVCFFLCRARRHLWDAQSRETVVIVEYIQVVGSRAR